MKLPGFASGSYTSLSVNADAQSCVNLYVEAIESGSGKASPVLYLRPGLQLFCTMPASGIRCMFVGEGRLFVVAGGTLYEVNQDTTTTGIISVGNDFRLAQMAVNANNQLGVASNQKFFIVPGGEAAFQPGFIESPGDLVTARQLAYLDSFFIAVDQIDAADTLSPRRFHYSLSLDGKQWSGND
jgi:hypothetical protein